MPDEVTANPTRHLLDAEKAFREQGRAYYRQNSMLYAEACRVDAEAVAVVARMIDAGDAQSILEAFGDEYGSHFDFD